TKPRLIARRQDGIPDDPIQQRTLAGTAAPFGNTPGPVRQRVGVALPLFGWIFLVETAVRQVDDLGAGASTGGGGFGELACIYVVHQNGVSTDQYGFRSRNPRVVRAPEGAVVILDRSQ